MEDLARDRVGAKVQKVLRIVRQLLAMSRDCEVPTYTKVALRDDTTVIKYGTWLAEPHQLTRAAITLLEQDVDALLDEVISRISKGHTLYEVEPCRAVKVGKNALLIVAVGGPIRVKSIKIVQSVIACYELGTLGDNTSE
jgi:hypothetical protein